MLNLGFYDTGRILLLTMALSFAIVREASAQTSDCAPKCRSGFTCVAGACVSACNPQCAPSETCSPAGECVTTSAVDGPGIKPGSMVLPEVDHHWEIAARIGYQAGGEISPKDMYVGKTSGAPIIFADVSRVVHPFFTAGLFSQYSRSNYQQYSNDISLGDGHLTLWSTGTVFKVRIPVSESFTVRAGGLVGANFIWASGTSYKIDYSGHGVGFDLGATLEAALRISRQFGASAHFGFSSQILTGSVSVDGDSRSHDLSYAPIVFLTIGPEFYL